MISRLKDHKIVVGGAINDEVDHLVEAINTIDKRIDDLIDTINRISDKFIETEAI